MWHFQLQTGAIWQQKELGEQESAHLLQATLSLREYERQKRHAIIVAAGEDQRR